MTRGDYFVVIILFFLLLSIACVSAAPIDDEFKKLANYAGEYETGNINYPQLLVYTSSIKEKMNGILGATGKEIGGVVKEEQIKNILGQATEETKWVWSEGEEKETKLDNDIPLWRKIVFDGKKIQIRLNAQPSIFSKKKVGNNEGGKLEDFEGKLIYRLNFEIEFKKPQEQLNIQSRINDIQEIAKIFSTNPSSENAETLAKESVNAEKTFEAYFRQSGQKCETTMENIFGAESKKQTQQMLVQEISFCEGDNFEVIARLEMCDDCEYNWIGLNFNIMGRGPGFKIEEKKNEYNSPESYKSLDATSLKSEIEKVINEVKQLCDAGDYSSIMNKQGEISSLNEALNQKSNDVWKELDKTYNSKVESMTQEQRMEFDQNYGWIKLEQEKRQKAKELGKVNYEVTKQFYSNLFSNYEKKDSYFTQVEYQKRLVEEFRENGKEICDNNIDDNKNEQIDCAEEQCGGKICGRGKSNVINGNETIESEVNFYCIQSECKAREERIEVVMNASNICPELPSIECSEGGKAFFSKYDNETNCPIETSCFDETTSCQVNEDCSQPACGLAECVENKCKVTELIECKESECVDGDEKICEADGKIVELCVEGLWQKIGECIQEPEIREEIIVGNECLSANDCGNDNVCNNGVCQVLPKVVIVEPIGEEKTEEIEGGEVKENEGDKEETETSRETIEETNQEESSEEQKSETESGEQGSESGSSDSDSSSESNLDSSSESPPVTGNVIFNFFGAVLSKIKITAAAITGFEIKEGSTEDSGDSGSNDGSSSEGGNDNGLEDGGEDSGSSGDSGGSDDGSSESGESGEDNREQEISEEQNNQEDRDNQEQENREDDRDREDERRDEENKKRESENKERCEKDCARPCIEKCIRDSCGDELNCVVEEAQKKCEESCKAENSCIDKCVKGGDWWQEFENKDEKKEEKGVFQAGGSCRTSQGKTEGFIWFGGWGESFEKIQYLKNKYYSGGQADWCKYEYENLKKQREEFEKGFNQEFVTWFFEKYLVNSAENWEQAVSGIFELYWKDVDNAREMAFRMQCLETNELPSVNLINVNYNTEYGSIEFWEEIKTTKLEGMDKEVQIITPYMKAWVFPTKEFIVYQMKKAMKNHEFPGSPEEKMERENQEGPTAEEKELIKENEKFMEKIKKVAEKYDGSLDAVVQFYDYETNETVFNLYAQVNEQDILKMEPMLPEETPATDVKIEIDFSIIYDMIYNQEKDMRGEMTESPPWDKKINPVQKVKEIKNGIKTYFKMRSIMNSAKITPVESEKDVKNILKTFMSMMMKEDSGSGDTDENKKNKEGGENSEAGSFEKKDSNSVTGNIIFGQK